MNESITTLLPVIGGLFVVVTVYITELKQFRSRPVKRYYS